MGWAQLGNVITSAETAIAGVVFVVTYQRLAPWRLTPVGRHLMAVTAAIALFGAYTVLFTLWPHGIPAVVLRCCRIVIGQGMSLLLIRQTWLLVRTQREGRAREEQHDASA
jgi:hypothetical protein